MSGEASALRVEVVTGRAPFVALEQEWNALAARCDDQIFYRHELLRIWLDNFAPTASLRILTGRDARGQLVAALPLVLRQARFHGLPVRELGAAANLHSCRFDLLADDPPSAAAAFIGKVVAEPGWDLLRLLDVPEGGRAHALLEAASLLGMPTGSWESLHSPYLPLPGSWEALAETTDAKFRANLRRRRRKLAQKGKVSLEQVSDTGQLAALLEEGLRLEVSGWKGRGGTAIAQDLATRGFYSELARTALHQGKLRMWFLRLDGRPVGFHFALEHRGRYLLLKPAYDEAIRECSPGQLLMEDVLQDCVSRGLGEFDFLGPDMPWKRDWTSRVRTHQWLFIFRPGAPGRLLHRLKFKILPWTKKKVTGWRR